MVTPPANDRGANEKRYSVGPHTYHQQGACWECEGRKMVELRERHEVQQGEVQSLIPKEEQTPTPIYAGDYPDGKQLAIKEVPSARTRGCRVRMYTQNQHTGGLSTRLMSSSDSSLMVVYLAEPNL